MPLIKSGQHVVFVAYIQDRDGHAVDRGEFVDADVAWMDQVFGGRVGRPADPEEAHRREYLADQFPAVGGWIGDEHHVVVAGRAADALIQSGLAACGR